MRNTTRALAMCVAGLSVSAMGVAAQPASGGGEGPRPAQRDEQRLVIYDVRDVLARFSGGTGQRSSRAVGGGDSPSSAGPGADDAVRMLSSLSFLSGGEGVLLPAGVFAMRAGPRQHEAFTSSLDQILSISENRYELELVLAQAPLGRSPSLGEPLGEATPLLSLRHATQQRTPTRFAATTTHTLITSWSPVVSDNAVGYEGHSATIESGLTATLTIGGGSDAEGISVSISGTVSDVGIEQRLEHLTASGLTIDLPIVRERSIQSTISVPLDSLVVISVVQGFEPGQEIAVAVRLRRSR